MLYTYRAIDRNGVAVPGEREAGSERELADLLRHEGLLMLDAKSPEEGARSARGIASRIPNPFRRVTLVERMVFSRNLAVMVGAGLSLTRAIDALAEQSSNPKFKKILAALRNDISRGKSFAESLRPYGNTFGPVFINMVEMGELSGNLEKVLTVLARQMKRDHDLRSKVKGALMYPAIVVSALFLIGILMMVYVVPTLTATFTELEIPLPFTTRVIIGASNFLLHYYLYTAIGFALVIAGALYAFRLPGFRHAFDRAVLVVPVFGELIRKLNSARFARTLSSLIAAGTPIARSLEVTAAVLGNNRFRDSLAGAAEGIQTGRALSDILKQHPDLYPPLVTEMLQVGEETGTTSRMLLRLALFYEEEVTATTRNLSNIIEPTLMIVIGVIVGFFAVSMIQPIYGGLGNL